MNTSIPAGRRPVRKPIRIHRGFNSFLRATLGKHLVRAYNVKAENLELFREISAPYVILPNHMSFWDPFFISTFVPEPVYYVTSDANFRSPILKFLLGLVGSIPKTKQMSDLETVKNIMRIRDGNGVIGIFPEGQRCWDGHTLPLLYSTAKLVRLLKIPVVVAVLKGAYLSLPRWTRRRRRGGITLEFRLCCTAQEAATLSTDEIFARMNGHLRFDEFEWQQTRMIPFAGKKTAENLELTLFMCPSCGRIGTLFSRGDRFSCSGCGYGVTYSRFGFFEAESGSLIHRTVRDWNLWQQGSLKAMLERKRGSGDGEPVLADGRTLLFTGYRQNPLKKIHAGEAVLYTDRMEFVPRNRARLVFPLSEVSGMNVQNRERLEFYFRNVLYSFRFPPRRVSSFKWILACSLLNEAVSLEGVVGRPVTV